MDVAAAGQLLGVGQAELLAHPQVPVLGCRARGHRKRRGRQRRDAGADCASGGVGPTSPLDQLHAQLAEVRVRSRIDLQLLLMRLALQRSAWLLVLGVVHRRRAAGGRPLGPGQHGSSDRQRFAAGGVHQQQLLLDTHRPHERSVRHRRPVSTPEARTEAGWAHGFVRWVMAWAVGG